MTGKITDTITATSVADRSQSGSAFFTLTTYTRFSIDPASATLRPGGEATFVAIGPDFLRSSISWQLSPKTGTIHERLIEPNPPRHLGSGIEGGYEALLPWPQVSVTYLAPRSSFQRQRVILNASSPTNDALASAGIELSPESSPLGRWAYLILAAAAGALGSYLAGTRVLLTYIGNRVFRTEWWAYFVFRPVLGAAAGLIAYVAVAGALGPVSVKSASAMAWGALLAGLFSDAIIGKLWPRTGFLRR